MQKEKLQTKKSSFWNDESGDIGVKQIAITVAVIVVVAFAITIFTTGTFLQDMIETVWGFFTGAIEKMIK